jgi:hypothetical protein
MAELRAALRSTLESAAAGAMFPGLSCGDLSTRTAPGPAPGVSSHADGTESAGMGADAAARHCAKAVELACSWRHRGATQDEDIEHSTNALADEIVAVAAWCPTPSRMRTLIHSAGSGVPLAAESRRDRDFAAPRPRVQGASEPPGSCPMAADSLQQRFRVPRTRCLHCTGGSCSAEVPAKWCGIPSEAPGRG